MTITKANDDIVRALIARSPFGALLGIEVEHTAIDEVRLRMPFRSEVTTIGDLVHGGAVSSLIDVAATGAAWTAAGLDANPRGTTVSLTVNFLAGARGHDLVATARVIRRGKSLVFCEVDVASPAGDLCARGLVTYKLG